MAVGWVGVGAAAGGEAAPLASSRLGVAGFVLRFGGDILLRCTKVLVSKATPQRFELHRLTELRSCECWLALGLGVVSIAGLYQGGAPAGVWWGAAEKEASVMVWGAQGQLWVWHWGVALFPSNTRQHTVITAPHRYRYAIALALNTIAALGLLTSLYCTTWWSIGT